MYVAMSRLKVISGKEAEFETKWKARETNTCGVKGFNWTKSDSFSLSHKNPILQRNLYLGPPDFEGYLGEPEFEGFKLII